MDETEFTTRQLIKLTKKELIHLLQAGCDTFEKFKNTREKQKLTRADFGYEPCSDCRRIAIKLGYEAE